MSANEEYLDRLLRELEGNISEEELTEPVEEVELEPMPEIEGEPEPEPEIIPEPDTGFALEMEPEAEPEIIQESEMEVEPETELETALESEAKVVIPDSEMEAVPEIIPEQETELETVPETDMDLEMEAEPEPEAVLEAILEPGPEAASEVIPEPEPEAAPKAIQEPELEAAPEVIPEPEAVPEIFLETESELELETEAEEPEALEPETEPEPVEIPQIDVELEPEAAMTEDELELEAVPELEDIPEMEDELAAVLGSGMEPDFGMDMDSDKQMSVEEIAALLQSIPELDDEGTSSQGSDGDGIDLMNLMGMMPEDENVSEINDLLEKNDSGEPVEDDMFSMFAQPDNDADNDSSIDFFASNLGESDMDTGTGDTGMDAVPSEESNDGQKKGKLSREEKKALKAQAKEKKAAEKAAKKALKKGGAEGDAEKPEKKKGFFGKLLDVLTEEAPEDDITIPPEQADGTADSENLAILQAIDNAPKDKKKSKKEKKPKKEKEPKPKKEKKPRKPKKEKPPKEKVEGPPEKKIPMRRIVPVILVCGTILAAVLIVLNVYPKASYVKSAQKEFDQGNYDAAYRVLSGWELTGDDEDLYKKAALLAKMRRRSEVYLNYVDENDVAHILDALIQAVKYHDNYAAEAAERGVGDAFEEIYQTVLGVLAEYDLSEEQAREFAAILDNVDYSIALEDFIYGPQEIVIDMPEEENDVPEEEPAEAVPEVSGASEDEADIGEAEEAPESDEAEDTSDDGEGVPEDSYEEPSQSENTESPGGNVSPGGERLLYEFGVEKGSDGKYHGGQ